MPVSAGTAYIDIKPDWSGLNSEISKRGPLLAKTFGGQFGKALGPVMAQQTKHIESAWRGVKIGAIAGAAAAAYGFKDVVEKGAEFEKQMSVNAAVSEANAKQLGKLEKQSIKLGKATFYSAKESAEAQGELIKGGLAVKQVLGGGLPAALSLAEAGQLDLATAATTTVNAMKLFGLEGREATSVADMLATAANKTTADVIDFAMALKQGGSVAKLAGYGMNETVAVLEALAEAGIKNSDAGTSLKTAFIQLLKPSEKQADLQKELGLRLLDNNGNLKDAAGLSEELRRVTDGMTKAERTKTLATLAGTDGVRTLNALYEQGADKLRSLEKANAKQGTAQTIAAKKMDNLAGEIEQFKGSVETAEISIYQGMAPALKELAGEATEAANRVGAIFENDNLSGSEKIEKSISLISHELGRLWDENEMTDHLVEVVDKAIPIIAEHAGKAGLEFAEGFGKGFVKADPLGQAVMAAWLLNFIGGKAAFVGVGRALGKEFGLSFATASAAEAGAAGVASSTASSAVGMAGGAAGARWLGTDAAPITAKTAGAFGERKLLEDASLIGGTGLAARAKGMLAKSMKLLGGAAGGYFAAEFSAQVIEGITGADLLENQDLKTALTHGFNTRGVLGTEVNALQKAEGFNADLSKAQLESLERHFAKTMEKIRSDASVGIGAVDHALATGLEQANTLWAHGTRPWRQHTVEAMQASVDEIHKGMKAGTIPVEAGQKRINQLLAKIELRKGSDPFGLAKATAESFSESGSITSAGVAKWTKQLEQMPKAAREQSRLATVGMLQSWAQGHPKIEAQIENLTQFQMRKFGIAGKSVANSQRLAMQHVVEANTGASASVAEALTSIGANLTNALKALGAGKLPEFKITMEAQAHHHPQFKQRGGEIAGTFTVPGSGSGDKVPLMLPPGSFIENREAATRLQTGGLTPVIAEPKERVWLPPAVDRVGLARLQARNAAIPRFQGGGQTGTAIPHPRIFGPDPLREGAQRGVDKVFQAAQRYYRKHAGGDRSIQELKRNANIIDIARLAYKWGGGHQSSPAPWLVDYDCSGALSALAQHSGWQIPTMTSSGFMSVGKPGRGRFTILANPDHVYSLIDGRAWGTSTENPGGGAGWISGYTVRPGFTIRHLPVKGEGESIGGKGRGRHGGGDKQVPGFQRGGLIDKVQRLAKGGAVKGIWAGTSIDKTYPKSDGTTGATLPFYVAAALGEWAGLPGVTMAQIGKSENLLHPGTDVADPPGRSYGWLAINDHYNPVTSEAMRNPINAILKAKEIVGSGLPSSSIWHATKYVTGYDLHYDGDPAKIAKHIGGSGGSDEHSFKEDVPAVYAGARTKALHFPSVPKNLKAIGRELRKWVREAGKYRKAKATAEKANRPGVAQAIGKNIAAIENQLRKLRSAQHKLRVEAAKKALSKRLSHKLGKVGMYEKVIAGSERAFNQASEYAARLVDLEPQTPEMPATATDAQREAAEKVWAEQTLPNYINQEERPAYERALGLAADWRNNILRAEYFGFGKGQPSVATMEAGWEKKVRTVSAHIDQINAFTKAVGEQLATYRKAHPKTKPADYPKWLKARLAERDKRRKQLPWLRFEDNELRKTIGEARGFFFPGGEHRIKPPALPLAGSGTLETALEGVQGIHWPDMHALLPASAFAPPRDPLRSGGALWDLTGTIEELDVKIRQAASGIAGSGSIEGESDLAALEKERRIQAEQRLAVSEAQRKTIADFTAVYPPYAGKAHTGTIVPGPPNAEKTMIVKGREGIFTEEQMAALGPAGGATGSEPRVIINGNIVQEKGDTRDPVEMVLGDRRFVPAVQQAARGTTVGRRGPGGIR